MVSNSAADPATVSGECDVLAGPVTVRSHWVKLGDENNLGRRASRDDP